MASSKELAGTGEGTEAAAREVAAREAGTGLEVREAAVSVALAGTAEDVASESPGSSRASRPRGWQATAC